MLFDVKVQKLYLNILQLFVQTFKLLKKGRQNFF